MTPEEICEKLKPILGVKIDRLWKAYIIEDNIGKREVEQMLQILYHQYFPAGFNQEKQSTLTPPAENIINGEYPLGQRRRQKASPFSLTYWSGLSGRNPWVPWEGLLFSCCFWSASLPIFWPPSVTTSLT